MPRKYPVHGKTADLSGLVMKGGEEINMRPNSIAPITQAAIQRKERMRQEKIGMMEEAYMRAEMRSDMMEKLMPGEM
jgi:hypothetical protein